MKYSRFLNWACNPHGSRELVAVELAPGHAQFFQRASARWSKTGKVVLVLTGLLAFFVGVSPSLHAGVIFTAGSGNDTVPLNGSVVIPITVSGFANLGGAQFSLTWSTEVLSFQSVAEVNSALSAGSAFGLPGTGSIPANTLTWLWSSGTATTLADNSAIFSLEFMASGSLGASTAVSIGNSPAPIRVFDIDGNPVSFTVNNDNLTIVPEPVNWALGLFACVFVGSATVRWISNRRMALRSA
jgi:hypothetical protein